MSRRRPGPAAQQQPLVVSFDAAGAVVDIVGDLVAMLGEEEPVEVVLQRLRDLLVGSEGRPITLSAFELTPDHYADIHVLQEDENLWHVVLLGNSEAMLTLRERQQASNEAALAQERQLRELGRVPLSHAQGQQMVGAFRRSSDLFAAIANDMRAPLATLSGHAQILARHCRQDPAALRSVAAIQHAAVRLDALSRNGLIGLGQLSASGAALDVLRLPQLAAWLEDSFGLQARSAQVALQLQLGRDTVAVVVDDLAVRQILVNLLIHALDALHGGTLTLSLKADERWLELELAHEPAGFAPERFGPLVTTDDLLRHHAGGSLSLAVSQQLLRQLQADIELVPRQDGGCDLWCRIPVRAAPAGGRLAFGGAGHAATAVVAVAPAALSRTVARLLPDHGVAVREAGDGARSPLPPLPHPPALLVASAELDGRPLREVCLALGIPADTPLLLIGESAHAALPGANCVQVSADADEATLAAVLEDMLGSLLQERQG